MITGNYPNLRLRRSRKNDWSRRLIQENSLSSSDFILPIFLIDGKNTKQSIKTMPDVYRYTIDKLGIIVDRAIKNKIPMVALFPYTNKTKKNDIGTEALNEDNLVCKAIRYIKKRYKNEIGIMCDVALDPYTSHGHDGLIKSGYVLNDETIELFGEEVTDAKSFKKVLDANMSESAEVNEAKKFKPGDMWSNDFDYDGMMKYALKVNHKTPLKTLQKLHDSATDVNYHTPFSGLGNAIDWITDDGVNSQEGKDFMKQFHNDIKNEIKNMK